MRKDQIVRAIIISLSILVIILFIYMEIYLFVIRPVPSGFESFDLLNWVFFILTIGVTISVGAVLIYAFLKGE